MAYGGTLQNFRIIAMGEDWATRVHAVGTEPLHVKPEYEMFPPAGNSDFITQTFGSLQRVEVWNDINDENDLRRRTKQLQKEISKVGQRVRLAIRVHSIDPFDGYDLTDSIPLDIQRGLVETQRYGSGYWTLWGLEYRVFPDGHDELTWAVKPREDEEDPDPDLIPSKPIHQTPEWFFSSGPPLPVGDPLQPDEMAKAIYYLDTTNNQVYQRLAPAFDTWVLQTDMTGPVGPEGPQGDPGSSIVIKGTDTWANISAIASPGTNDMWILAADDAAAPDRPNGTGGEAGDGVVWDGAQWTNVGPIRGPDGPSGSDGQDGATGPEGPQGPTGPRGAIRRGRTAG